VVCKIGPLTLVRARVARSNKDAGAAHRGCPQRLLDRRTPSLAHRAVASPPAERNDVGTRVVRDRVEHLDLTGKSVRGFVDEDLRPRRNCAHDLNVEVGLWMTVGGPAADGHVPWTWSRYAEASVEPPHVSVAETGV
jgi:hypothetical protein